MFKNTNFIIFRNSRKLLHCDDSVDILINGIKIERVRYYVKIFRRVYIDEYLRWDEHIQQITSKVAKKFGDYQ